MGRLLERYREDLKESLGLLYEERDRVRSAHNTAKAAIREDRKSGRIDPEEAGKLIKKMRDILSWSMDGIFDKIRERRRVLDRLEEKLDEQRRIPTKTD